MEEHESARQGVCLAQVGDGEIGDRKLALGGAMGGRYQ